MIDAPFGEECPKHMVFGPCGGVTAAGGCEVDQRRCPFVGAPLRQLPADVEHRPRPVDVGRFVIDLRMPADEAVLAEVAAIYRDVGATVLVGEHVDDPADAAPHRHAERLSAVGLPAIVTVTGRTRTPDEHRAEIERLLAAGVVAVHCVTGDHPAARFGPGATATFTLDGTRLATLARAAGARVTVSESPVAPPIELRAARVSMKQRAGADLAILNHAGRPDEVVEFAERCTEVGADLALVAPVPVITDGSSARALAQFPGLALPAGLTDRILGSNDLRRAGVDAAVSHGRELLGSGRFVTLNLSGSGTAGGPVERARIMAEVAVELVA